MSQPLVPKVGRREDQLDYRKHLIDLVIKQDQVIQNWTRFMITIQGALALAFWFVVQGLHNHTAIYELASTFIPFFGIISTAGLGIIVLRNHRWQAWFTVKFQQLTHDNGVIFPRHQDEKFIWPRN